MSKIDFGDFFEGNIAETNGGGMALIQCGEVDLLNGTFNENEASGIGSGGYGGAIYARDTDYRVERSYFSGNVALMEGGEAKVIANLEGNAWNAFFALLSHIFQFYRFLNTVNRA